MSMSFQDAQDALIDLAGTVLIWQALSIAWETVFGFDGYSVIGAFLVGFVLLFRKMLFGPKEEPKKEKYTSLKNSMPMRVLFDGK